MSKIVKLDMRFKKVNKDLFVGQSVDFPFMILKAKSVEELTAKMFKHMDVYFNTFPKEREKFLKATQYETRPQKMQLNKEQLLTISVSKH
jgi:hypothetical protein